MKSYEQKHYKTWNCEDIQEFLEDKIQEARDYRVEKGKPPMTKQEEDELRDRFRLSIAR